MTTAERPAECLDEHLQYLDALRESGATNMFGATPYLMRAFGLSQPIAKKVLLYWMETFGERHASDRKKGR